MNRKNNKILKAVVAIAVALAFVLPGSAVVVNIGTIGRTLERETIERIDLNFDANIDGEPFPPMYHHYFYGTVRIAGAPAPNGTIVNARGPYPIQNGTNNPLVTTQAGYYGIPDPKLDCAGVNAPDGLLITFWVNNEYTGESYIFKRGATSRVNLTLWENDPPYVSDPNPADGQTGLPLNVTLSWTGGDPHGDPVTYNVYFGSTSPPPQIAWNQSTTTYAVSNLTEKTAYYWRVVAWDNQSASTSSPIWRFITYGPPAVVYVDDDRAPEWYDHWHVHTIQEGVNNASDGEFDTVYVFPGLYYGLVTVNKQIMMTGVSKDTVIVDGGGTGTVVSILVSTLNISGFTIKNGTTGILLKNTAPYVHNITIRDCNVFGNTKAGVDISRSSDTNIINCTVHHNIAPTGSTTIGNGIFLLACNRCNVTGCNVYNNSAPQLALYAGVGIYIQASTNCKLRNNNIYNNQYNFRMMGNNIGYYENHDIDTSNTVDGKPLYYIVGATDTVFDGDTTNIGHIALIRCNNVTVKNIETSHSGSGVLLIGTWNSTITDCTLSKNVYGIWCYVRSSYNRIINCIIFDNVNYEGTGVRTQDDSNFNEIINCTIYDNSHLGYWSQGTLNNSIIGCTIYNNGASGTNLNYGGIRFDYKTDNNLVDDCHIYGNYYGIITYTYCQNQLIKNSEIHNNQKSGLYIAGSLNTIMDCGFYNNAQYGIYITGSQADSSLIYHNNFGNNNIKNAYDSRTNQWDNGSIGNYWDDYTGIDANGDGIGDTPYNITGKTPPNQDHYPLMLPLDSTPPVITDVQATPDVQNTTAPVNITSTVTDNWDLVDTVTVYITGPEGFALNATMNANESQYWYEHTYVTMGVYYYYIQANDTNGNIAVSELYSFSITDLDKPVSSVNPLPSWRKTASFTIIATAYDNTAVANVTLWYRYSINGTTWTYWTAYGIDEASPWSWTFTGSGDGYYEFYSIAVDDYGNVEAAPRIADASTGIDTVKPVAASSLVPPEPNGNNGWYVSPVMVILSATDALSGVESIWYQLDTGYWTLYSTPFTVSSDGQHMVQYYSFDYAGNQGITNSISFKIDKIAPVTTHTFDGLLGGSGWYVSDVTVTLSATDATSGVDYTKYKLNDGEWLLYTEPFDVTEDDDYTLYYYSVDLAGNTEPTQEVVFKIEHDVTPPVTTHEFDGVVGENDWFTSLILVTLSAEDDAAGVDYTMYKLDTGAWTTYMGPFSVTDDGIHTLWYYSVDLVGNKETDNGPIGFKIDQIAPSISFAVEKTGVLKWLLTATVSDQTSGIAKVEFYLNDEYLGEDTTVPYTWEVTKQGTAQALVYDNAGNTNLSDELPVSVNLDLSSQSTTQGQSSPSGQTHTISSLSQQPSNLMTMTTDVQSPDVTQASAEDTTWLRQSAMLDPDWIHFDDGTNVNAIGLTAGGTFEFAIRITPAELVGYDGYELTVVRWHHGYTSSPPHSGTIKIYDAGTSSSPGSLITSEPFTVPSADWFEIPLSNPAPIVASKDIWVSIQVTHAAGEYPAGVGPGPVIPGKGGWISIDGVTWQQLGIDITTLDYNWNIWAKVEEPSEPPATPLQPSGPSEGIIEVAYTFSTSTTDPEGEQISYLWDWDDGTPLEWTEYYDSGETVYAFHGWASAGAYEIRVKAKDLHEEESDWSEPKTIHIVDMPLIKLGNITGGLFKITAVVKNLGGVDASKVNWSITLTGGIILLGKESTGTILSLPAGDEKTISSDVILGFGKTMITVTAECAESSDIAEQEAFVFLIFIR